MWTLGFPPTSITSTRCRSTISTTWPLLGCTTSLETMPQRKWWAPLCLHTINHVHLNELTATLLLVSEINLNTQQPGMTRVPIVLSNFCCKADASFFYLSSPRLSMRSETTHIPSCTCWLCRVSTPPATHLQLERAMRFVRLFPRSPQQTHQSTLIYHCFLCDQSLERLEW